MRVKCLHLGITLAVELERNIPELLAHRVIHHPAPHRRFVEPAAIQFDRVIAVHKDVVLHVVVAASAKKRRTLHPEKDVPGNLRPAHAVVHVGAHRAHPDAARVMDEIVADPIPPESVVPPGVDRADIACLKRDVMDLVELDQVLVASVQDRAVRVIVDQVVRRPQPHALEENRRHVTLRPSTLMLEMAVLHEMPTRLQRPAIAPAQVHPAVAGVEHIARLHAMTAPPLDDHPAVPNVPDQTAHDAIRPAPPDLHRARTRRLEDQPFNNDIRGARDADQRFVQQAQQGLLRPRFSPAVRRPEIELARTPVEIPLPRRIQLLEEVEKIETLPLPESIQAMRRQRLHVVPIQVQRRDALVRVGPVPGPVAMHPDITHIAPTIGPISRIQKPPRQLPEVPPMFVDAP